MGEFDKKNYDIKFQKENYDRIQILVKKGVKDIIKEKANSENLSVNKYIIGLIEKDINIKIN